MTERQYGIVSSIILHGIILLIMFFTYIALSKPATSEGGILINFGDTESAFGPTEPALNNRATAAQAPATASQPVRAEEGLLTQDFEEAPAVKKPDAKKIVEKKTEVKPTAKSETNKTTVSETKTPEVNKKALYTGKSSTAGQSTTESGSSEGIYKGSGNMGNPTGSTESDNYTQGLGGEGIGLDLTGRSPEHLPKPAFDVQAQGSVVVEIMVDRSGKVISADPGKQGSTTSDKTLYDAARKAALNSKFNKKDDAPELQIGKITYHFKLQ